MENLDSLHKFSVKYHGIAAKNQVSISSKNSLFLQIKIFV